MAHCVTEASRSFMILVGKKDPWHASWNSMNVRVQLHPWMSVASMFGKKLMRQSRSRNIHVDKYSRANVATLIAMVL